MFLMRMMEKMKHKLRLGRMPKCRKKRRLKRIRDGFTAAMKREIAKTKKLEKSS